MSHTYSDGKRVWKVKSIWKAAEGLESFEWEIPDSLLKGWTWGSTTPSAHVERVLRADLSYPVILHGETVLDGMHRICKAVYLGHSTVSAVRVEVLPDPDGYCDESREEPQSWSFGQLVSVMRLSAQDDKYRYRHPIDGF